MDIINWINSLHPILKWEIIANGIGLGIIAIAFLIGNICYLAQELLSKFYCWFEN